MPQDTDDEKSQGKTWGERQLRAYIAQRNQAAMEFITERMEKAQKRQVRKEAFNPQQWWRKSAGRKKG